MKLAVNLIPSLLIPLLNLRMNDSNSLLPLNDTAALDGYTIPSDIPFIAGATPTGAVAQAVFTHHPHHEPHREHEHGGDEHHRNENHHRNNGEGEKGMKRPRVGQQRVRAQPLTRQKTSSSCPVPPVVSCSPQAEETDTCCVSF